MDFKISTESLVDIITGAGPEQTMLVIESLIDELHPSLLEEVISSAEDAMNEFLYIAEMEQDDDDPIEIGDNVRVVRADVLDNIFGGYFTDEIFTVDNIVDFAGITLYYKAGVQMGLPESQIERY